MKKLLLPFMILTSLLFSIFSLSSCGLIPYYQTPKSVTINDEKYAKGFYKNLYLVGLEYQESSTSLFLKDNHYWWHLEDSPFDIYYAQHKDAAYWRPTLYCKKEQFTEIEKYYKNLDNFDYYLGIYLEKEKETKLSDSINVALIERAVSAIIDKDNGTTRKYKKSSLELSGKEYLRPTIYRKSKDKLFTTTQSEWIYYEGKLYIFDYTRGSNDIYHVILLDDETHSYVVDLLKEYGFAD